MSNNQIQDKLNNLADHIIELTGSNKELYKHLNRIAGSINRVDTTVEDLQRRLDSMNGMIEYQDSRTDELTKQLYSMNDIEPRIATLEVNTDIEDSKSIKETIKSHYGELSQAASELGRQLDKFKKDTNNELHKFAAHIGTEIGELKAHVENLQSKEKAREQGCTTQPAPHQLSTIGATTGRSECCNSGDRTSEKSTEAVGQSKQETSPYKRDTKELIGVYPPSSFYMAGRVTTYSDLHVYEQDLAKYKKVGKEPYSVTLLDGRRYLTWKLHLRDARDEEYKMTAAVDVNKYGYETTDCTSPNPPQKAKTEKVCPGIEQIPFHSIERIGAIFEEGRIKYGRDNWKKGVGDNEFITERIKHMIRHLMLFANGDRQEDHLAKVGWGSVALMELIRLGEENGRED